MKHLPQKTFLELHSVSKRYPVFSLFPFKRTYKQALSSIDLVLEKGRVTCILGPNGAGKTTMLKIIADLITQDSGEIIQQRKRDAGFVTPNERSFYWRLSGRENLRFFAALNHIHGSSRERRVSSVIEETGITEYADTPYRLYSTGMKQRLNIARALLSEPQLILLDEPTSHLDPLAKADFWKFIRNRILKERNATVLLATHDLEEATILADTVAIIHNGKIVARGTINDLQERMAQYRTITLTYQRRKDSEEQIITAMEEFGLAPEISTTDISICTTDEDSIYAIMNVLSKKGILPYTLKRNNASLLKIIEHYARKKPDHEKGNRR